jgi:hypothetical protein
VIILAEEGFYVSKEEKEEIEKKLVSISDYQRLSSLLVWLGLLMVILHIAADIFFHVIN